MQEELSCFLDNSETTVSSRMTCVDAGHVGASKGKMSWFSIAERDHSMVSERDCVRFKGHELWFIWTVSGTLV